MLFYMRIHRILGGRNEEGFSFLLTCTRNCDTVTNHESELIIDLICKTN